LYESITEDDMVIHELEAGDKLSALILRR